MNLVSSALRPITILVLAATNGPSQTGPVESFTAPFRRWLQLAARAHRGSAPSCHPVSPTHSSHP
jgi:hypothetical protein